MDKKEKTDLYIKGYRQGLKDAWADIESMVSNEPEYWDLKSKIQSRIGTLYQDVESKRKELKKDPSDVSLEGKETGNVEEEEEKRGPKDIPWNPGDVYLFIEERPHDSIEDLVDIVQDGVPALFVLRRSPRKIFERFDASFENCKFTKLSREEGTSETFEGMEVKRKSPDDLSGLSGIIGKFLKEEENPAIFLSDISFLKDYNEERKLLRFLHFVKDKITANDACMVTSLPSKSVEEKFLGKVKGESDRIYR